MSELKEQERRTIKRIAEELDAIADGTAFFYDECPEDIFYLMDDENEEFEGCIPEEAYAAGMIHYFSDVYNTVYMVNENRQYIGVRVMVACGGPNIWVDTYEREIVLYWGADVERCPLWSATCSAIDALFEEFWEMDE